MFTCLAYWYFKGRKLNLHCVRYRTCIPCRLRIQLGSTLDQAVNFVDMLNYSRMLHFQRTFTKYINVTFCWQFCVHSDKKKMLEELTNDIHQSPNKQKVLMELANCIASGEDIHCIARFLWLYVLINPPIFNTRVLLQIKYYLWLIIEAVLVNCIQHLVKLE